MDALLFLKASLVFAATLAASRLLRRAPATSRHGLWTFGFAAVLLLPIASTALPSLDVPVPVSWRALSKRTPVARDFSPAIHVDVTASTASDRPVRPTDPTVLPAEAPAGDRPLSFTSGVPRLIGAVWLTGVLAAGCAILLSLLRTSRLARAAEVLTEPAWQQAASDIGRRLDLRRAARLLVSPDVHTPMAGGFWRPVVYLPACAPGWTADRRDIVLTHELAHAAVRDPMRHLVARLALGVYWFHPLAWLGARDAAVAREQACDEAVLALGTRRSDYARVLLEMAESMPASARPLGALPMVQRSSLERRLMAILDTDARSTTRLTVVWTAIGVAVFTLSVASARPSAVGPMASAAEPPPVSSAVVVDEVAPTGPTVEPAGQPASAPAAQSAVTRDSACWWDMDARSSSFSGSTSFSSNNVSTSRDGTRIYEQIGTRNGDRVILKSFGSLQLCMVAEGLGGRTANERPSDWIGRARRVVLEARDGRDLQRMEIESGGKSTRAWQINGADRAVDRAAAEWRDRMLALLDTTWEISTLRGEVSTLRGEISTLHGRRSTLQGEISTLHGEVSTMRGRQSTIRGEVSTREGEISTIHGHVSTLRGAISTEQGAISSLNARQYGADSGERARLNARIADHDAEIARIERQIRDYNAPARIAAVEREIGRLDADRRVAAIEAEIRAFDLDGRVAAVERRIRALDVDREVAAIERRIANLDADRRVRQLESRRDDELARLETAIRAVGR